MIKIRYGVFETNSSSVHTLSIAQNEEIEKLKNNELLVSTYWGSSDKFLTYEEALKELIKEIGNSHGELELINSGNKEKIYELMREYDIAQPLEDYLNSDWFESYEKTIVTEHGDTIMMFGLYGHD